MEKNVCMQQSLHWTAEINLNIANELHFNKKVEKKKL